MLFPEDKEIHLVDEMRKIRYSQAGIRSWFDTKYRNIGLGYLRPRDAYHIFLRLLGTMPDQRILDVACGPGLLLSVANEKGLKTHGVDFSFEALKMCNIHIPQAKVVLANAEALPYPDKQFDYITCIGSLERFMDLEKSLSEQIRVAKDNAHFCYMVRNSNTFTWKIFMKYLGFQNHISHQGAMTLNEWKGIFIRSGFEILNVCHDHWPYLRFLRLITFGGQFIDYNKARRPLLPIEHAYEFIFTLKKKSASHAL
jgi:ubiquinone/menaquinone biosynthesis C-methylase UbiE